MQRDPFYMTIPDMPSVRLVPETDAEDPILSKDDQLAAEDGRGTGSSEARRISAIHSVSENGSSESPFSSPNATSGDLQRCCVAGADSTSIGEGERRDAEDPELELADGVPHSLPESPSDSTSGTTSARLFPLSV